MPTDGWSLEGGLKKAVNALRWPLILLVLFLLSGNLAMGPLLRSAVERSLEEALESEVSVHKVTHGLLSGSTELRHIRVHNLQGSTPGQVLTVPRVTVVMGATDLLARDIELDAVRLYDASVLFEVRPSGVNFVELLTRLEERISRLREKTPRADTPAARRFKIHKLTVRGLEFALRGNPETGQTHPLARVPRLTLELTDRWYGLEEALHTLLVAMHEAFRQHSDPHSLPEALLSELGPEHPGSFRAGATSSLPGLGKTATQSR